MRIYDVADWLIGELPDRREDLVTQRRELRIDQQHSLVTGLYGDVAPRAHEHVDISLHWQDVNFDLVQILLLLSVRSVC